MSPTPDLMPDALNALSALTLAEAQECFVRKAINGQSPHPLGCIRDALIPAYLQFILLDGFLQLCRQLSARRHRVYGLSMHACVIKFVSSKFSGRGIQINGLSFVLVVIIQVFIVYLVLSD